MGSYKGKCVVCGTQDVLLNDMTDKCITCIRLDSIEEILEDNNIKASYLIKEEE